jgi:hypothetical protein
MAGMMIKCHLLNSKSSLACLPIIYNRFDEEYFLHDKSDNDDADVINISSLTLSQEEIINRCKFMNTDFISPTHGLEHSVIENSMIVA